MKSIFYKLLQTADFYVIIFLYILAIFFYQVASGFPVIPGAPRAQNPGFYPMLLAVMLFVLNSIYLAQTIIRIWKAEDILSEKASKPAEKMEAENSKEEQEDEGFKIKAIKEDDSLQPGQKKREPFWGESTPLTKIYLLLTVIMTYLYIHMLNWLGFLPSTFIMMFVISRTISSKEKFKTSRLIFISVLVTLAFFVVFDLIIGVRFPDGIIF